MKHLFIFLFFASFYCNAQDYVDIIRLGYGETFNNNFEGTNADTNISFIEADVTLPVVLDENNALITGFSYSKNSLQLFPDSKNFNLYSTILKVGLASTYSEKYSSTIILLPKIASDYRNISGSDLYFGGLALLKYQKNENLKYRFGIYASTEAFGLFTTPIIGWYYLSPNKKFEMDMSLPIAADVSYKFGKTSVGLDYFGIGRSFKLHQNNLNNQYVDVSSLDFAAYLQYNALENSVLIRGKVGYSTSNYEVYNNDEKINLGVSAFSFGDDRVQLNPNISGGAYFKIEAIYRFHIVKKL